MKLAKLLGLAMVAAIAAMALFGTGTASAADALCYVKEKPCKEANLVPAGKHLSSTLQPLPENRGTHAILKGVGTVVTCQKSSSNGEVTINPGTTESKEQVQGTMGEITFEECSLGGEPCTVNKINQSLYRVHGDQGTNAGEGTMYVGSMTKQGTEEVTGMQPGAELGAGCKQNVFPFINLEGCIYKVNEEQPKDTGTGKIWAKLKLKDQEEGGVQTDHADAEQVKLKSNLIKCGSEGFWEAQYTLLAEEKNGTTFVPVFMSSFP